MNESPKTKSGWRWPRRILIAAAILATLIAILYAEEDWRGKRAWETFKHDWEAKGEKFDWQAFVPPSVPDDQNFYSAPIVADAWKWHGNQPTDATEANDVNAVNRMNFSIYRGDSKFWPESGGNWQKGTLTDLKPWQSYFRNFAATPEGKSNGFPVAAQPQTPAADILLALSVFDPAIEELRQASRRPYARMPFDYESGFNSVGELLPWLANMKRCAQLFHLRILVELANGQSEQALDDVKLLLRLNDSIRNPPFLISQLVRMAVASIALQPVWEGLAEHKWSDEQLVALDAELAKQDFLADYESAMRGERAFAIAEFENQRRTRESKQLEEINGTNKIVTISYRFLPGAFFYQNELAFARMHEQWTLPLVDTNSRTVSIATMRRADSEVQAEMKHYSLYKVQALMVFPAVAAAVKKFAFIQASIDLARVACALERHRLAHGEYPETLDALAPQFIEKIPHDIINGQPLHYRRTDDGKFILYSVGWNETDDGGQVVLTKSGSVDREKGDWVWQCPQK